MKLVMNLMALLLIASMAGCGAVGVLVSKSEHHDGHEAYEISVPRVDMLDIFAAVGKDMGMDVASINNANNTVLMITSSSTATLLVGSISNASISAGIKNGGKLIDIKYSTMGNFGKGGKDASIKLLAEFKAKLESRLGEKIVDKGEFNSQLLSMIVGSPAPQSKFAKLKLGMSINQVKSLIGESKDCWLNPQDVSNFLISGYDCPYKGEGLLIFDWNRQSLFRVEVDTTMGEYRSAQN
jgi:hypothetical protein